MDPREFFPVLNETNVVVGFLRKADVPREYLDRQSFKLRALEATSVTSGPIATGPTSTTYHEVMFQRLAVGGQRYTGQELAGRWRVECLQIHGGEAARQVSKVRGFMLFAEALGDSIMQPGDH